MEPTWAYFDTSTYLKLYVREQGTEKAVKTAKTHRIVSSSVLSVECLSALSRRQQAGEVDEKTFKAILKNIRQGLEAVETVRVTDDVLKQAEEITLRSVARAMDAIHLSSALLFREKTGIDLAFVTSDTKQHEAALHEGLRTVFVG
ncbi:MAG: type II toxin-antitoxin system VapC family toxin [Nitrospirota bacterium]|nr:type II toxin-antitoxin system VapC family toxin [Nitrospirota bacterium]